MAASADTWSLLMTPRETVTPQPGRDKIHRQPGSDQSSSWSLDIRLFAADTENTLREDYS
jgi:hypothetical protein